MRRDHHRSIEMSARAERSWIQRNAKWVVLGAVLLGFLMLASVVAGILVLVNTAMTSSDVYRAAVARAQSDPAVISAIGAPVQTGFLTRGNISMKNNSGEADLQIPISGPLGEASLNIVASRRDGVWTFSRMRVQPEHSAVIDLLEPPSEQ
jgi:hypothetical protein